MAARLSWSKTAPFGRPVVPLVHTIATGSDGSIDGRRAGGPSSHHDAMSSSAVITVRGRACSMIPATSAGPSRRLMPDVIAPRRIAA
jgi:hypothetical protein